MCIRNEKGHRGELDLNTSTRSQHINFVPNKMNIKLYIFHPLMKNWVCGHLNDIDNVTIDDGSYVNRLSTSWRRLCTSFSNYVGDTMIFCICTRTWDRVLPLRGLWDNNQVLIYEWLGIPSLRQIKRWGS